MKITLLTLFLFFFYNAKAQTTNTALVEKSPLIKLYKIAADSAEKYIKQNEIPIEQFENATPFATFLNNSFTEDSLPNGHYVAISLDGIYIKANIVSKSNITPVILNNKQNLQIQLREQNGNFIASATIFVNKKQAKFNANSNSYWLKQKQPNDAFVKIITSTDTIFFELSSKDDLGNFYCKTTLEKF